MSLLPTATYGAVREPLFIPNSEGRGPVGAVQYKDGAGNIRGNAGLVYDGIGTLSNTATDNSLSLNTNGGVVLTANTLALDIAGSPGPIGWVLTSDGDVATWQPSAGGGGGAPATWALYPATNNVDIANFDIENCKTLKTTTIQGPGVAPGVVTSVSDLDMSGNNIINLSVMSGTVAGPGQPKTTSLDSSVLIDVGGVQGVADTQNIRKIDTNLSVLENLRGLKGAINPSGVPTFGFNGSIVDEIAGIRGAPNFAGTPVIDANQTRIRNLLGIQGVVNPATGIGALDVGDSILDGVAGIIGVPLPGSGQPILSMGDTRLIKVSELEGSIPPGQISPLLYVTSDMDLNLNNIVGCQLIAVSTVNTGDLVLNSAFGASRVSITIDGNGTILGNGNPLIYTGLSGPAPADIGYSNFAINVPGVRPVSIVIATVQVPDQPGDEATWLINCVPGIGRLTFNLAAEITPGSQLKISWMVTQL
jgi:hypothetical protein